MLFANVFLHVKILRIASQAAQASVKTSPKILKAVENPTYATVRPTMIEATRANILISPIHLLRRALCNRNAKDYSNCPLEDPEHAIDSNLSPPYAFCYSKGDYFFFLSAVGIAYQVSTPILSAIPS
jgi:hypothetical protein